MKLLGHCWGCGSLLSLALTAWFADGTVGNAQTTKTTTTPTTTTPTTGGKVPTTTPPTTTTPTSGGKGPNTTTPTTGSKGTTTTTGGKTTTPSTGTGVTLRSQGNIRGMYNPRVIGGYSSGLGGYSGYGGMSTGISPFGSSNINYGGASGNQGVLMITPNGGYNANSMYGNQNNGGFGPYSNPNSGGFPGGPNSFMNTAAYMPFNQNSTGFPGWPSAAMNTVTYVPFNPNPNYTTMFANPYANSFNPYQYSFGANPYANPYQYQNNFMFSNPSANANGFANPYAFNNFPTGAANPGFLGGYRPMLPIDNGYFGAWTMGLGGLGYRGY